MKRIFPALALLAFFNYSNAQKIISTDINNFWIAYDSIQKNKTHKSEILETLFLNKKTDGLKAFMEIKKFGKEDY